MRLGIGDNGYAELHIVQCMAGLWWYQGHQNCDLSKVSSRLWLKGFSNNFMASSLIVIPALFIGLISNLHMLFHAFSDYMGKTRNRKSKC